LWPNRLIGDEQKPAEYQYAGVAGVATPRGGSANSITAIPDWYAHGKARPSGERVTFTTWHHWNANDPLLESGLIGPVMLRVAKPLAVTGN